MPDNLTPAERYEAALADEKTKDQRNPAGGEYIAGLEWAQSKFREVFGEVDAPTCGACEFFNTTCPACKTVNKSNTKLTTTAKANL